MSLFGTNLSKVKLGHFIQIIHSQAAIDNFVGGYNHLKKIRHFSNRSLWFDEPFTDFKLNELKRQGIPVIDMTKGQSIPRESVFNPESHGILCSIQFSRRLREG